ncbi:MAG: hypothetical protein P4L57_14730 [Rhizomicrobium sp.]|nr:hypothetical protein [Rhizomicrobium sp.]
MSPKPWKLATALLVSTALTVIPLMSAAEAGGLSTGHSGGSQPGANCNGGNGGGNNGGKGGGITINKPVTINKNINIYKPVTINKDINIYKPVTINKTIDNSKNITINKNIEINKSIVINKGGSGSAEASAFASAYASASANASASASANNNIVIYGGSNEYVTVNNHSGEIGAIGVAISTTGQCLMQEATVVKSVHAVCISPEGREFPASHMVAETWIDGGLEGEVLRCIPGAHLKITVGDVLQTDQGMAGTYASGQVLECASSEALRHFKDGMLKCTPKVWVKDCTERTNLRRWGTSDMFFSFRTSVCVPQKTAAAPVSREIEVTGLNLNGGVGEQ